VNPFEPPRPESWDVQADGLRRSPPPPPPPLHRTNYVLETRLMAGACGALLLVFGYLSDSYGGVAIGLSTLGWALVLAPRMLGKRRRNRPPGKVL